MMPGITMAGAFECASWTRFCRPRPLRRAAAGAPLGRPAPKPAYRRQALQRLPYVPGLAAGRAKSPRLALPDQRGAFSATFWRILRHVAAVEGRRFMSGQRTQLEPRHDR